MINKQKYTIEQVEGIIDSHIENDKDFTFICNFELAHYIYDYLGNEYDLEATSVELSSEIDEYYVSMSFYEDGDIDFFCEFAKWDQTGTYKYSEGIDLDYFVFSGMSFGDVREFLGGKDCKIVFCELVDEDCVEEYCQCCNCENKCDDFECTCNMDDNNETENGNMIDEDVCSVCGEVDCDCGECMCDDCRSQRHDDIVNASVGKAFEKIMASEGCPNCIVDALFEMSLEMKRLGWSDHQMYISECNA